MTKRPDKFIVSPHRGALPIELGMSRAEVHKILGKPRHVARRNTEYFCKNGLQIEFRKAQAIFIQLSRNCGFQVEFQGFDVFQHPVDQVIEWICKTSHYDEDRPDLGYTFVFHDLEVALWRPVKDDPEEPYFETIAVATKGYWL